MNTQIIAEIGWNHMGNEILAEEMVKAAVSSGATIVKFQYWDPQFLIKGDWDSDGRREIYNNAALNEEKIINLQKICKKYKIDFLISVFGTRGAKKIKNLGIKNIKIPSHEVANKKLIKFCAENFEEIFFSSGASTEEDVKYANDIFKKSCVDYCLMHCISSYPCPSEKTNLPRLKWLKDLHERVGFSDHSQSVITPSLSLSFGVSAVEKHFTTNKALPGRDNKFALDAEEFSQMVSYIRETENTLIDHGKNFIDIENDTVTNYRGRWEPHDYE